MSPLFIITAIIYIVLCISLVSLVLFQKKKQAGLGGMTGSGGGGGNTFWEKNKKNSLEGQLERYTRIVGILFFVLSFALGIFNM